jgi:uncharacterized protein (TIGR00369 family)
MAPPPPVFQRLRESLEVGETVEWPAEASAAVPAGCLLDVLGIRGTRLGPGAAHAEMAVTPAHLNQRGVVQGGAVVALADAVAGWATYCALPADRAFSTIELNANLTGTARDGDLLTAVASPVHIGRSTVVLEVAVHRGERLCARFRCTQLVLPG